MWRSADGTADAAAAAATPALAPPTAEDQRWRAEPLRLSDWQAWFAQQLSYSSKAKPENGLFVGLRLDGRVRSSGSGVPPFKRYALELAPLEGEGESVHALLPDRARPGTSTGAGRRCRLVKSMCVCDTVVCEVPTKLQGLVMGACLVGFGA